MLEAFQEDGELSLKKFPELAQLRQAVRFGEFGLDDESFCLNSADVCVIFLLFFASLNEVLSVALAGNSKRRVLAQWQRSCPVGSALDAS